MKTRFLYAAALVLVIFAFVGASCSALFDEPSSGGAVKAPKPEPESSGNAEWTFIVYMAADNNLESAAIADLNEMEEARSFLSAGNTILVLLDRASAFDATNGDWSDTRLFRVASDNSVSPSVLTSERLCCPELGLDAESETELDMANKETLSNLLAFARREYEARHYALIVWGHGNGWRDGGSGGGGRAVAADSFSDSSMTISDLRAAIDSGMDGGALDFVGFDTCFGNCLELCYELSSSALLLAGTPALVPAGGWDYTAFLEFFAASDGSALALSQAALRQFKDSYASYGHACFSVVSLPEIQDVVQSFDALARAAANTVHDEGAARHYSDLCEREIRSYCAAEFPCDYFLDVADFSKKLGEADSALCEPARALSESLERAVMLSWSADGGESSFGVFYSDFEAAACPSYTHPPLYVNGSRETGQCRFVRDFSGYVPTAARSGSFLDTVFYKSY